MRTGRHAAGTVHDAADDPMRPAFDQHRAWRTWAALVVLVLAAAVALGTWANAPHAIGLAPMPEWLQDSWWLAVFMSCAGAQFAGLVLILLDPKLPTAARLALALGASALPVVPLVYWLAVVERRPRARPARAA